MARRHTEDVFNTLQQVQRRLSQHTDGGTTDSVVTSRPHTSPSYSALQKRREAASSRSPEQPPATSKKRQTFSLNTASSPAPQHARPVAEAPPEAEEWQDDDHPSPPLQQHFAHQRQSSPGAPAGALVLNLHVALALIVVWIATVVGAYMLGGSGGSTASGPGVSIASGEAGERTESDILRQRELDAQRERSSRSSSAQITPTVRGSRSGSESSRQPLGNHVLVLESVNRASRAGQERFQEIADRYNAIAEDHIDQGFQPWFGVRRTSAGGLQLVFGHLGGDTFGIPNDNDLARKMFQQMRESRFPDAFWVRIHN
ncbi:MAG: hypothetical protein EA401_13705 [Planctomycetota bacterium]|nr:MAG: hypothetical protein EA401_13705 [Planctomycetota bacterium]